jgi:hypothetical protein
VRQRRIHHGDTENTENTEKSFTENKWVLFLRVPFLCDLRVSVVDF